MSSDGTGAATREEEAAQELVPKRRFPEFRDARAWTEQTLASLCLRITNGKANAEDHEEDGEYPLFDRSAVIKRSNEYCFEGEAVILPGEGMRFQPRYYKGRFNLHQRAYTLMEHRDDARFVFHSLDYMQNEIAEKAVKSTVLSLRLPIIQKFSLPVPGRPEQEQIAGCLSSLDAVIAAERDRLTALRTYKEGLMQALFPAPGQTTPRLRFPEFRDAGEWKERALAQISPAVFDGTHQTPTYVDDGVPFYSVENLVSGAANRFISQADHDVATAKNKPEMGDLLLTRIGRIGFSKIIDWAGSFSIYVTLAVVKKSSAFNTGYLHAFVQSERYQAELAQRSLLNAVPCKINMDELRRSVVLLPGMSEQKRIADCFCDCDRRIATQADTLRSLKAHKTGLMQQLFPSLAGGTS